MPENERNLTGEFREQTLSSAMDFFGNSVRFVRSRIENDRAQMQSLWEKFPESQEKARSQLQKLVGSYEDIEYILDRVIQKQGVEELLGQTPRRTADNLPPGSILLNETTNEQGRIVQRSLDETGTIIESVLAESGEPISEEIVGVIADLPSEDDSG